MRRLVASVALFLAGAFLGLAVAFFVATGRGPQPEPWHRFHPQEELTAGMEERVPDLEAYRRLEDRLFAEVERELARRVDAFPPFSRFDPASPTHPGRFEGNWNRTWELSPPGELRGEALLVHGLSDSPYSLRAVGGALAERGYHVVAVRMPGHGTVPGGLARAGRDDWRAAVRLGAAATGGRAGERPFLLVGYSNGAALALDYTLASLEAEDAPVPDGLVFLSPAFAVTRAAAYAGLPLALSRLPGLSSLAWNPLQAEVDPFKTSSFPVAAAAEIHRLTTEIEERLGRLEGRAGGTGLPPILAIQSAVDATVPPVESLTRLFSRVGDGTAELVLFDANRAAGIGSLLGPSADELLSLATPGRRFPFRVSLVTNAGTGTAAVEMVERPPGSLADRRTPLELAWPEGVYSLSHVAIPFPPDDPAYGVGTSPAGPPFPFGDLELKGERGVFLVPAERFSRLRYNPFFPVVEDRVARFADTLAGDP